MGPYGAFVRVLGLAAFVFAVPPLLGGCIALRKDLDPIRSDVSVMEKQFMELQREQARLSAKLDESGQSGGASGEAMLRIKSLEARIQVLETRLEDMSRASHAAGGGMTTGPVMMPEPSMQPEAVVVEPSGEISAQPPIIVTPGVAPTLPERAPMAAEDLYGEAMTSYKAGDMTAAEAGFRRLFDEYPENRLADNALYWLGDIEFGRKQYGTAIERFRRVVNEYPVGDKAPDAVFMMGRSYEELGQADKAREAYNRVMDNYPYSDAARNARQRLEGIH